MRDLARNVEKLMKVKGLNRATVAKMANKLGFTLTISSVTKMLEGETDFRFSLIEKLSVVFGVKPEHLISAAGFDDQGRPVASKGGVLESDVQWASSNSLKYFLKAVDEKRLKINDIDFDSFGEMVKLVAIAYARGGEIDANNQIIKCMAKYY